MTLCLGATSLLHVQSAPSSLGFTTQAACFLYWLQEWAVRTLQRGKEGDPGRLPAVLRAMKELREAHRFFTYLHNLGKVGRAPYFCGMVAAFTCFAAANSSRLRL